jgi:hypothetical protein
METTPNRKPKDDPYDPLCCADFVAAGSQSVILSIGRNRRRMAEA